MRNVRLENNMYNTALTLYIFQSICVFMSLEDGTFRAFISVLTYIILLLLIVKFVLSKYKKKEFLAILVLLVYGMYTFHATSDSSLLFFVAFIVCAKNIDEERTMKIALRAFLISICLGLLLYFVGISPDIIKYKNDGTPVHAYGFTNPNSLALVALQPILLWIYFKYNKFLIRDYFGVAISGLLIFLITKSRSVLVIVLFLLVLLPNVSAISKRRGVERLLRILVMTPAVCAFISFFLTYLYNNENAFVMLASTLLSGRLLGQGITVRLYGVPILPFVDNPVYLSPYTLDNSYVRIACHQGFISLLIVLLLYTISMNRMYKRREYEKLILLSAIAVLSLFETSLYRIVINITILMLGEALYSNNVSDESDTIEP